MPLEKRRFHRIPVSIKIAYRSPETPLRVHEAESVDLSLDGLCLKTPLYRPLSDQIRGSLVIPAEKPIAFESRLLWNKPDKLERLSGLRFLFLEGKEKENLDRFLKSVWNQMLTVY
jgi:c-di-GMP-binding flagellar brake protein YcgR